MSEALREKTDLHAELLSVAIGLRDHWLNPVRTSNTNTVELTMNEQGVQRLRGYVQDEKPDIASIQYNAFVGIAFVDNLIMAEIHYPFSSTKITSFISLDVETDIVSAYDLKESPTMQFKEKRLLNEGGKLETLIELTNYFERLTNFSIPYEEKYARDIERIKEVRVEILEIFPIKTYVFEMSALK